MNTIEIRDEEIDVEEIMRKIRENIKDRRESGTGEMNDLIDEPIQTAEIGESNTDYLQQEIDYLNRYMDIHAEYSISSHRPIMGRFLIKGRQLVHEEVRRYIDLIVGKQIEFNAHVARLINGLIPDIDDKNRKVRTELRGEIDDKVDLVKTELSREIWDRVSQVKTELSGEIDDKVDLVKTEVSREIWDRVSQVKTELSGEIDDKVDLVKTEVSREIWDRVSQVKTELSGEIDDKVDLVKTELSREIWDRVSQVKTELSGEIDDKVSQVKTEIGEVIEGKVNELVATINEDIKNKAWLADILERRIKTIEHPDRNTLESAYINYFVFSDEMGEAWTKISGRSVETPNVFEGSIKLFSHCKNVLEIGCGRGYFLQMLKENGIGGYGIELNEDFVRYCQRLGLEVQKIDALTHLNSIEDKSIDGIFMGQVIEHLPPEVSHDVLKLCYQKLQYGAHIVIVTPNILNMTVSTNLFYMDPTHVTHVHPEVIKFLLRSCGYRDIQEQFYQPEYKLKKIVFGDTSNTEEQKKFLEIMNHNIDMLNNLLFGNRDYAVIAKK
jgi:O-antigen chain-terminating methyltransferase